MDKGDKKDLYKKLSYFGGKLTIIFYISLLVIAWGLFPNPASPLDHWLSDLGRYEVPIDGGAVWRLVDGVYKTFVELGINSIFNPGSIFYNIGCILAGISMIIFFMGLLGYKNEKDNHFNTLTYVLLILGLLGGVFLVIIGIFAEDGILLFYINSEVTYPIHHISTIIFFILLFIIKLVAGLWSWKLELNKYLSIYSWIIIIFDLIVVITGNNFALIEWLSVLTSLGLVGMISISLRLKTHS